MSCYCCRPATDGSLDEHAPPIAIPEGIPTNANAAEDLPYYVVTIVDDEDATSAPAQPAPAASATQVPCHPIADRRALPCSFPQACHSLPPAPFITVGGWCKNECAFPLSGAFPFGLNPASSTAQAAAPRQEEATPENGMPPAFSTDSALVSTGAKAESGAAEAAAATEKIKDSSGEGVEAAPPAASEQAAAKNAQKGGCCGCTIC